MSKISICKAFAFIKRDFLTELSYKLSFLLSWFSIFFSIAIFYFISKLIGNNTVSSLKEYGGLYFPFVFIGIALSGYLTISLGTFSTNIRREQMIGTLEAMLISPTKLSTIIISMSLWNFIFNSIIILIYLVFGVFLFGLDLTNANFLCVIIVLILTVISFSSIGIISASFIMVFKKGDPITWAISLLSAFFGGVYFPINVLPKSLQNISHLLPITYTLRSSRLALLQGYSFKMLLHDIVILLVFAIALLPISISIFKYAVRKVKLAGTLAHY